MNRLNRRHVLQTLLAASAVPAASALQAQSAPDVAALILRHAQTVAGVGDPPSFRLDQCSTQRNLSDEGRDQSKRIGQWFTAHQLVIGSVQSSAWCRCKDTATLSFGHFDLLPALNSTFDSRNIQAAQTGVLMERLTSLHAGQIEVRVTHKVNIASMTGEPPAIGEAFVVKLGPESSSRRVLAHTSFTCDILE